MRLHIIAVGNKMPKWVSEAVGDYAKRFNGRYPLSITEILPEKRTKTSNISSIKEKEGIKILQAIPNKTHSIILDERGKLWSTENLVAELKIFQTKTAVLNFVIGGPDGLSTACLQHTHVHWSLSPLTLPHPMVRIILTEQLYRAVSILNNHPYHRQ
jgi:23S rRNA (pseudouridine1915-N3)-methyltransferase